MNDICKKCGGHINPPKHWMSINPPRLCKARLTWPQVKKGCK